MKQKKLAMLPLSLIIILCFTITVSAFYFDFQYFETDKMVYEVGESVNMVAGLVADFSPEGYCFVSFAIVTDQGPAFADEYFISPSPSFRILNSTYVIHPEQTQPGEEGITAYALFNVELYDSVTQGASDNIEFTINRGHLTVYPQIPLVVQYNTNTTLTLKVASTHNSDISYSNQNINVTIRNPEFEIILNENMATDSNGNFYINWTESMGFPGIYDLIITGCGNEDFLEFSKIFQISVVPSSSNLTVVSAPTSLLCQSPQGNNFDYIDIIVKHETIDNTTIDDSIVFWDASFGNGLFAYIGNGEYSASIPFTVPPGVYSINVTATNSKYETATTSIIVEAIRNSLSFTLTQNLQPVIHGNNISIEFLVEEEFNWDESFPLEITDSVNEISQSFEVYPGIIDSLTITAWQNISIGPHNLTISVLDNHYSFLFSPEFQIVVIGEFTTALSVESAYYAEAVILNISTLNYEYMNIEILDISVYNGTETVPFLTIYHINITEFVSLKLPSWIKPGNHEFRFQLMAPYYVTVNIFKNVTVIMRTNITIVIEASNSDLLILEKCDSVSIQLTQVIHSVLSFDRRQFCLPIALHRYLSLHA